MKQSILLRQIIDFNKASFDNSFNTMELIHGQSEMIANEFCSQTERSSEEVKAVLSKWGKLFRKNSEELKKAVDEGYMKLSVLFNETEGKATKEAQKERPTSDKPNTGKNKSTEA